MPRKPAFPCRAASSASSSIAVVVLPLVPVTAASVIICAGLPARRAASSASARRGFSTVTQATDGGVPAGAGRSDTIAAAPLAIARGMKSKPSAFSPAIATKTSPAATCREL